MATSNLSDKSVESNKVLQVNEAKWTSDLMSAGWTAFPSVILENQAALKLEAVDVNILLYLSTLWWTADNKPHPAKSTIATAIGVSPRTVQRRVTRMEKLGLIKREERRVKGQGSKPNNYHFDGLIAAAKPFAQDKLAEIAERTAKKKRKAAGIKEKPKLRVVK